MLTLNSRVFIRPCQPRHLPGFWKKTLLTLDILTQLYPTTLQLSALAEFQEWCHYRGIKHLTGAPYHPVTNGPMTFHVSLIFLLQHSPVDGVHVGLYAVIYTLDSDNVCFFTDGCILFLSRAPNLLFYYSKEL